MKFSIRLLYLYLFSFIGLIVAVIGLIRIIQLGIKVYIFNGADQYTYSVPVSPDGKQISAPQNNDLETQRQREREVAEATTMILVGLPLYLYHWRIIQKEA